MPVKRSSAAGSPAQFGSSSSKLRSEASQDVYGISDVSSVLGRPDGTGGEQRVIQALVNRLVAKLPCNSGIRLNVMEEDAAVIATGKSLMQMAHIQLGGVVHALVTAVESQLKYFNGVGSELPLETLQSQTYLLNVLSKCLDSQWYRQVNKQSPSNDIPKLWPDPRPIDDNLAKYLITVLLALVRTTNVEPSPGTSSPAPSRETKTLGTSSIASWSRSLSAGFTSSGLGADFLREHCTMEKPNGEIPKLAQACDTNEACTIHLTSCIARIIFHLSASNWPVLLARLKSRLHQLTTTIEDAPDVTELRLLEWSNINRQRMSQILQEVSTTFLHVKRPAQIMVATVMRKAIWNFIEPHPLEFQALIQSDRKIEGGADVLFDILQSMSDISSSSAARRTKVFYPLMAMLMVLCPDIMTRITMETGSRSMGSLTKKRNFLDSLRKGLGATKGFEACLVCYVDLISAAAYVSPTLDGSGLRAFVPDIQGDLKTALLGPQSRDEVGDISIIVDGIAALFKVDPVSMTSSALPQLLNDNDVNKLIALRSLQALVSSPRLPWSPPLANLRRDLAGTIHRHFQSLVSAMLGDSSRRPRASPDLPASQSDLVAEILKLYALDPSFVVDKDATEVTTRSLIVISSLMVSPSPEFLRTAATRTCCAFLRYISKLDDSNTVLLEACVDAMWTMERDVHRQLLFAIQTVDLYDMNDAFIASRDIGEALICAAERFPGVFSASPMGDAASLAGLVATLSCLCSPDFEHVGTTMPTLNVLAQITEIAYRNQLPKAGPDGTNFGDPQARIAGRIALLKELADMPPAIGRQQQQRMLRKIYRPYCLPSSGGLAVWTGWAQVSRTMMTKIEAASGSRRNVASEAHGLNDGESKLWQNVVFFLISSSGICAYDGSPPPSLVKTVGKGLLPRVYDDPPDAKAACEQFLRKCVDLLVNPSIFVRETIKEGLGNELPLYWAKVVVSQMVKILSHSIGSTGVTISETFTTFVDQILIVLRLTIERLRPVENGTPTVVETREILGLLVQYLSRLPRDVEAMKTKIRFCQLVEAIMSKRDITILSDMATLRTELFDILVEWSGDPQDHDAYRLNISENNKVQMDLERASLKAMVPVTDTLTIKTDDEQNSLNSRQFHKYLHHLLRVLERAQLDISSIESPSPSGGDTASLVILVLSNLVASNMDIGLKHCLSLGYHEDPNLRIIFMQIMSTILRSGKFGTTTSKRMSSTPRPYLGALTSSSSNLALAVAVCEACPPSDVDEMSTLLFRIFEARGNILGLLRVLTEREVAMTLHEPDLFRANSITTRILTLFAKTYGYNYIRGTIQPLLNTLGAKPSGTSFELDPAKVSPDEDIERNADHLQFVCQALLGLICSSASDAPVMFRVLCHYLWSAVEEKFPDSRHSVVGSFIFLRFFCPAIVAPEQIDLDMSSGLQEVRRGLLLITKVIQNLASNVMFGNKEPHMKVLNPFLEQNIHEVTKFLSNLAIRPRSYEIAHAVKESQEEGGRTADVEGDESYLHRFIHKHRTKIEASLDAMPPHFGKTSDKLLSTRGELDGKASLQALRQIMEETGPPAHSLLAAPARVQAYEEFMKRNAGRAVDSVANVFYEGPASQNGRRMFYFVASRISVVDYDLLAYHIFQILDNITDFFDLIIDFTHFTPASEPPMGWLMRTLQLCPSTIFPCLHTLALYNPNTYCRTRLRRIIADLLLVVPAAGKNIVGVCSPGELAEHISFTSLALPEPTMILAYEADHVFTNLLYLQDHERQVPVVVKLGHDCMQLASWRRQDITPSIKSYTIDIIQLRDIDDVVTGGTLPSDYLILKHSQTESITFISKKRVEMAQIIRAARSRLRDDLSSNRTLKSSDAPGTLLNVAMLNLASSDETLRLGSISLINELSQFYKWHSASRKLKASAGLAVPANSLTFTTDLSKALAASAPHLTLEFMKEWTIGFSKADVAQKVASLQYVQPWLLNLETYAKPSREGVASVKQVEEIIRSLASITISERQRLQPAIQEKVWGVLRSSHETLIDIIVTELLSLAADAGLGSEKTECAADILVSMTSTVVRGRVVAKLRKVISQTYLKPTARLSQHIFWNEISTLARVLLKLSLDVKDPLSIQLFLPEVFHIATILLGQESLTMRQTIYGIVMNTVQSLVAGEPTGDMDASGLQELLASLSDPAMVRAFGLAPNSHSLELQDIPQKDLSDGLLESVQKVTAFLGDVLAAAATSLDCANAWRARWMSLVAATCFQHNPATQAQAFTVLGHLASGETDDDLVYQLLVAMGSTLHHFSESDSLLVNSMLRCLAEFMPGLGPNSRYPLNLFWLSVGILQLGYIPLFGSALDLMLAALKAMSPTKCMETLMEGRQGSEEPSQQLDQLAGVSFTTNVSFSLVAVVFRGIRHPSTRKRTIEIMLQLLRLTRSKGKTEAVDADGVAFFMAMLPISAESPQELKTLWTAAGLDPAESMDLRGVSILNLLSLPDNSTALLLIALAVSILNFASAEHEKLVLYKMLAEAAAEMPEVMLMIYDVLIPRMTATMSTTSSVPILNYITTIMERAMSDPNYSFPAAITSAESTSSLHLHKSYSQSISSNPSVGPSARDQVLEDLGMRGISELTFPGLKMDRVAPMAKWVAGLIETFTI